METQAYASTTETGTTDDGSYVGFLYMPVPVVLLTMWLLGATLMGLCGLVFYVFYVLWASLVGF